MMNSERKELLKKLKSALDEQERIRYSVLSFVTAVINRDEELSEGKKADLLNKIWKDEDEK